MDVKNDSPVLVCKICRVGVPFPERGGTRRRSVCRVGPTCRFGLFNVSCLSTAQVGMSFKVPRPNFNMGEETPPSHHTKKFLDTRRVSENSTQL